MNWQTSTGGVVTIIAGIGSILDAYLDGNPATMPSWLVAGGLIATGLSNICSADARKVKQLKAQVDDQSKSPFVPEPKAQ